MCKWPGRRVLPAAGASRCKRHWREVSPLEVTGTVAPGKRRVNAVRVCAASGRASMRGGRRGNERPWSGSLTRR
jgi:hypothetical protein